MLRCLIAIFALLAAPIASAETTADAGLYRITMLRAAPGQWYELKAIIEGQGEAGGESESGRMIPFRIRHSQGDQWDFMLIQPIASWERYFSEDRQVLEEPVRAAIEEHADYELDWFVSGPSHAEARELFANARIYHLEMFRARAGMRGKLEDSRIRENAIFEDVGAKPNTIWVGQFGSDYDVMTIGFHASWAAYAEHNGTGSDEEWEALSRKHGYAGAGDLSPQLRSFLTAHNDTFAVPMR